MAPGTRMAAIVALWPCSVPPVDSASYCYAAFEHTQFKSPDGQRMVVAYSTNTTDFSSMVRHPNLYWPRLTTIDLSSVGL